jgi:prepilin-type N-terminal cleavage/methylation domain-containing protein
MSNEPASDPRYGFTLIEVLVVLAVVGVLAALLLPAVQSAREASRRAQCLNNLKQHGLALGGYVSAMDAFPIGCLSWPNPPGGAAPGWAWAVAILPHLEQGPLFSAMNVDAPIDAPANGTVRNAALAVFACPSDRGPGELTADSAVVGGPVEAKTTSFAANQGVDGSAQGGDGMFRVNKSVRPRDVKDGLSNTLAVGERGRFIVRNAWAGALGDGRGPDEVLARIPAGGLDVANPSPASFGGPHPGATHFLTADGSARGLKTTTTPAVYRALATRSGRDAIDQGAY